MFLFSAADHFQAVLPIRVWIDSGCYDGLLKQLRPAAVAAMATATQLHPKLGSGGGSLEMPADIAELSIAICQRKGQQLIRISLWLPVPQLYRL